jgi:hypothetical protein
MGDGNDSLEIASDFDSGTGAGQFSAALTIDGQADTDLTLLNASLNVASLNVTSRIITLGANITTAAGGAVALNGPTRIAGDLTIDTSAGGGSNITFGGTITSLNASNDLTLNAGAAGNVNVNDAVT